MKLKLIQKAKASRNGAPRISFNSSGYLTINRSAAEKYKLEVGTGIGILQDEEKPNDFYLVSGEHPEFQKLRSTTGSSLICGYSSAKEKIQSHFHLEGKSFGLHLGGQIKTEFGSAIILITAPLIEIKRRKEAEKGGVNG